ncbi:cytochrome P460 family protein [Spiribacter halobius]|uniref:cytochrome P460 family protein n=1 Tax=Sediminicurvatus halobius TaxID=2182432 RepID=UPI001304C2E1|nr:cytochrome P460 family protein [Spiribacter halobius]UEX76223.1 cytochrome P460 family protein [Spiribacter halobius]
MGATVSITVLAVAAAVALGGPERVAYPENYAATFVRYMTVDKPEREPPIVRFLYVAPDALAMARPGAPLPDGTVVVMEDHLARLGDDGQPLTDANGRFLPGTEVTNVFVQEKRAGWGEIYPPEKRNGDWEYAWFRPDGARRSDRSMDACFECHRSVADQDYTFTTAPFVERVKGE